jgi:hypothetical protein
MTSGQRPEACERFAHCKPIDQTPFFKKFLEEMEDTFTLGERECDLTGQGLDTTISI